MAMMEDVQRLVAQLPEVSEGLRWRARTWFVADKGFVWERPLSKADIKRLGDRQPPQGPLLGVRTANLVEKEAILAQGRRGFFTIEHFRNYPAYLIQLKAVSDTDLREAIFDAWLACAPEPLADAYMARCGASPARKTG